jgi:RNA-binding protein YhbY
MAQLKKLQIGKNGLTPEFLETLKHQFDNTKTLKISVLKTGGRESLENYSKKMIEHLGNRFTYRIIGFTITLKKWGRDVTKQKEEI